MRVERFSLFFPPSSAPQEEVGETEYALGAIPLGGYVKISGMNPAEDLPDEVRTRAYYAQPVWKRIVVIAAGPAVNFVLALHAAVRRTSGCRRPRDRTCDQVAQIEKGYPAAGRAQAGRQGRVAWTASAATPGACCDQADRRRTSCAERPPRQGLQGRRRRRRRGRARRQAHDASSSRPIYDAAGPKRMRAGLRLRARTRARPVAARRGRRHDSPTASGSSPGRRSSCPRALRRREAQGDHRRGRHLRDHPPDDPRRRRRRGRDPRVISLSLAIINLFPFLPLDGGHIFWAIVEKVRRRPGPARGDGARGHDRLHARDGPVRHRVVERHRPAAGDGFSVR